MSLRFLAVCAIAGSLLVGLPARFTLPPRAVGQDNSCLGDHATLVIFRQSGRGFLLWIAAGRRAPKAKISTLLNALTALTIKRVAS